MIYRFGSFELHPAQYRLSHQQTTVPVKPRVLELLVYLVERRDRVVSKEELLSGLWNGRFVGDGVLSEAVHEARRALGEDAAKATFIKTVHGRGYEFVFRPVQIIETENDSSGAEKCSAYLLWTGGPTPLRDTETLIGRDATSAIILDNLRVSRHHARVVLASNVATLEDLGSKNGTALNGTRVSAPTPLSDGDVIEIGGFTITFRGMSNVSTMTQVPRQRPSRTMDRA